MRLVMCFAIALLLSSSVGCGKQTKYAEAEKIDVSVEVDTLLKRINDPNPLVYRSVIRRLGELGSPAQKAIPEIEKCAKKHPIIKKDADEAIARIKGAAPAPQ